MNGERRHAGTKFLYWIYSKRENDVSSNCPEIFTLALDRVVQIVTTQLSRQIARCAIACRASAPPNSNQCLTAGAVDSCTAGNGATSAGSGSGSGLRSSAISST